MLPALIAPLPWGVSSALHRGLAAAFPRGAEVVRVNAPPRGTFEDCVASVELARRAKGLERAVVVGHSMATLVALRAALDFPATTAGLILAGGAAGRDALREGLWRPGHAKHEAWFRSFRRFRRDGDMRRYVQDLIRASLARAEAWPALKADLDAAFLDSQRMDAFFRAELPCHDLGPRLREVRCPTVVIAGRDDPLCTLRASEQLAKGIPGARLEVLDGGHFLWYERPEAFRAALTRFLEEVGDAASANAPLR